MVSSQLRIHNDRLEARPSWWDPWGDFTILQPSLIPRQNATFLFFGSIPSEIQKFKKKLGGGFFPKPSEKKCDCSQIGSFPLIFGEKYKTKKKYLKPFVGTCRKTRDLEREYWQKTPRTVQPLNFKGWFVSFRWVKIKKKMKPL